MAEKRQESGFTVTDRRLFTEDGELRKDVPEEADATEGCDTSRLGSNAWPRKLRPSASTVATFPAEADGNRGTRHASGPYRGRAAGAGRRLPGIFARNWTRAWSSAATPPKSLR